MIQIEDLECKGLKIMQDKSLYTFTTDSVILANFLKIKRGEVAVEIGTGCGVVSALACAKNSFDTIFAFEIDKNLFDLAKQNVKLNNLQDKITVFNDKIQNFNKYLPKNSVDVVFSNPPYMKREENLQVNQTRLNARHENLLSMEEICQSVQNMLKFAGRFYIVYSAERSCELISCLIKHDLQPKTMFFTENGKGKVVLVVIEAIKGGKSGVKVLPNLCTNDQNGKFLERLQTRNFLKK